MRFVNLTPHAIVVRVSSPDGERDITFPASGTLARVNVTDVDAGFITVDGDSFPSTNAMFGEVENLPEPIPDTMFIVSGMVLARCGGRADVVGPNTGPPTCKNPPVRESGQIVAVRGFVRAPSI